MASVTFQIVNFALGTTFEDLPQEVIDKAKLLLLDCIGCALAGSATDRGKIATRMAINVGCKDTATIIGASKTSPVLASFANGELINALDFDPLGPCTAHVIPYVLPSLLASSELRDSSGKDFIVAMVIALELGGRISGSLAPLMRTEGNSSERQFELSTRHTYGPSIIGAVLGASRLLRLSEAKAAFACGIAGVNTPAAAGAKWTVEPMPTMVKYNSSPGMISLIATMSSLLARDGYTGDGRIFDGDYGYSLIIGSDPKRWKRVLEDLGQEWRVLEVEFKPYPCCRCNHAGIDALNRIIVENSIDPDEILAITVRGEPLLLTPNRSMIEAQPLEEAQFSNHYIFAAAAYMGRKQGSIWQLEDSSYKHKISNLMKNIAVEIYPEAMEERLGGRGKPAVVEVKTKKGSFTCETRYPRGSVANPMRRRELRQKFRHIASYSTLEEERTEEILTLVEKVEKVQHIRELMELLRP